MMATNSGVKQKAKFSALNSVRAGALQRKCACGGTPGLSGECEACRKKRLQRKINNLRAEEQNNSEAPPIVHEVLRSPGHPLDRETRAFMEPRFGHDFGNVRVHSDPSAAESARAVNAQAYTVGRHIVFNRGNYTPATDKGRQLLGHELAHVVQQSGAIGNQAQLQIGEATDLAEREADEAARTHVSDGPAKISRQAGRLSLQRKWDWGRAGRGALIGGGIGTLVGGLASLALGPAALLVGLGAGALIGGLIGGLTGREEQKKQQKPQAAPPAPGCTPVNDGMITSGLREGLTMLQTTIAALTGLSPKAPPGDRSRRAADAMKRFFKSDDSRVVNHVSRRLVQIKDFMSALTQKRAAPQSGAKEPPNNNAIAPIECHSVQDDEDCGRAIAYALEVRPGHTEREGMVFCPRFFESNTAKNDQERGGIVIHEAAHSLKGGENIGDRGYADLRFFPDLSTEDALTNADSYRVFVLQVAGDSEQTVGHMFHDDVQDCGPDEPKVGQALARIQRWLGVAKIVVHDKRPTWRALAYWVDLRTKYLGGDSQDLVDAAAKSYDAIGGMLGMFLSARCHPKADATCPPGTATASSPGALGPDIQLCPDWLAEKDPDRQAILLFAEMLGSTGIPVGQARLNHAEMARQLFLDLGQAPPLEKILAPFETPATSGPSKAAPPATKP